MKQGLQAYLADRPSIQAIFVGTRRTDPHGENLKHFDPTDAGWPPFMRVHPVVDWHYGTSACSGGPDGFVPGWEYPLHSFFLGRYASGLSMLPP